MKVVVNDDEKIVLYLYNYFFVYDEKRDMVREIKELFIKLIKYYSLEMGGIYTVLTYENDKYGTVLEIKKQEDILFNKDLIDIKVKIIPKSKFILKTKDFDIFKNYRNIYYFDEEYYINIDDIDDITNVIEFVEIIYTEKDIFNNMIKVK